MYSLAHARVNLRAESSCLPEQLRHIIRFCLHAFDRDAVDFPLLPSANRFCGCFRLCSGPVFCGLVFSRFCFAFSAGETQVWLGDLRVVAFCVVVVSLFCFNRFADFKDFASLYRVFAAYSHVRTEPLARHRPHSKNKKSEFCFGGACIFCFGEFNAGIL